MKLFLSLLFGAVLKWWQARQSLTEARKAGVAQANAETSSQTASKEAAIAQAATDAPNTKDEVVVALRRGEF